MLHIVYLCLSTFSDNCVFTTCWVDGGGPDFKFCGTDFICRRCTRVDLYLVLPLGLGMEFLSLEFSILSWRWHPISPPSNMGCLAHQSIQIAGPVSSKAIVWLVVWLPFLAFFPLILGISNHPNWWTHINPALQPNSSRTFIIGCVCIILFALNLACNFF